MPVRNDGYPRLSEPSCFDKIKMGFLIGCMVGLGSGALFGTYNSFRVGFRGAELIRHTSKSMLSGGATFGTFMAIGSGIRC